MEVAEADVLDAARKLLRGERVDLADVQRPLARAHEALVDHDVGEHEVHGGRGQVPGEEGQDLLDALRVLLVPLVLGGHDLAGVDHLALVDEGQHGDPGFLRAVAAPEGHHPALVGRAGLGADVDAQALEEMPERAELLSDGRGCRR